MTDNELIQALLDDPESPLTQAHVHREVCPQCRGEGSSSAYLGAYTESEWYEMDDEWRDDYMRGAFDKTCERCDGLRVVWELDDDAPAEAQAALREHYEDEAERRSEMRWGY